MKILYIFFSIALATANGCETSKNVKDLSYSEFTNNKIEQKNDSILVNIQNKIDSEFTKSFVNRNTKKLDEIDSELEKSSLPISKYWQAYTKYNKAIYFMANKNKEESEKLTEEGIKILEKNSKSSESYALLGTLLNFSIQFKSPITIGIVSDKAKKNFNKAIELEPKNLRGYLGLASLDYYTPEKYGGKKETEKYIKEALEKPDQPINNPIMPSWGRNLAYEIIIKFYIEKGDKETAKKYYREAIEKFPNDYQLSSLSKKLI